MTIDGAIKHCEEEAEKYMEYGIETECYQCAKEHEQLAEWLKELKEAKRLLKAAVKDIYHYVDCYEAHCDECCCDHDNHCHWKYEAEALKLIEGDTNG